MIEQENLAQRKKRRTRELIAQQAMQLFLARGFEHVSVAEIAAAAEVAEKTVYNHFPTKAHLVFDEDPAVLAGLVDAVRSRAPGQPVLAAIRDFLPGRVRELGSRRPQVDRATFRTMVMASPNLREHQRAMAARYEHELARVLAEQTGAEPDAPEPFIAAVAIVGTLRAAFETSASAGGPDKAVERALRVLETGLADYGTDLTVTAEQGHD